MCSHAPIPPPPLPPTLGEPSVRFRTPKCEHLHQGTTNSFILPQRTLPWQQMLVMSKPPDVQFLKAVACLGVWEVNISSPHMFSRLQTLQDRRLDVTLAAKRLRPVSWPSWSSKCSIPFNTNNQCYFFFNRLDSPNKGKYFLTLLNFIFLYFLCFNSIKLPNIPLVSFICVNNNT